MKRIIKCLVFTSLLGFSFASNNESSNYKNNVLVKNANSNDDLKATAITVTPNGDLKSEVGFAFKTNKANFNISIDIVEEEINDFNDESNIHLTLSNGITTNTNKGSDEDKICYRAKVSGLKENTSYIYRVGSENNYSDVGSFLTSGEDEAFNFVHISDPQGVSQSDYIPYVNMLNLISEEFDPSILAFTGDFVDNAKEGRINNASKQWSYALDDAKSSLTNTILAPVSGNHENGKYQFSSQFNLKVDDRDIEESGNFYSFKYNEVYFLGINTNDTTNTTSSDATGLSDDQLDFIKEDLEKNKDCKWKVVLMHKGLFDPGEHSSNHQYESGVYHDYDIDKIREQLVPLFDKYHVDIVLQGHDHLYSLTYPTIKGSTYYEIGEYTEKYISYNGNNYLIKNVSNGTIYTNTSTSSGTKNYVITDYDKNNFHFEKEEGNSGQMFTNYQVSDNYIYVDTYKYNNSSKEATLYYSWGLTKDKIETSNSKDEEIDNKNDNLGLILGITIPVGILIIGGGFARFLIIKKKKRG